MSDLALEIKSLGEKINATLVATKEAQDASNEIKSQYNTDRETVIAASEAATKAMSEAQELKQKIDAVEKTAQYVETAIARMGSGGEDGAGKELEKKAHDEMVSYLRDRKSLSPEVIEATSRALAGQTFHGISEERMSTEVKSLVAGSNPDGGYFIRPERSTKMIQRIFETSALRTLADVQSTNSSSVELIIDDEEADTGGWVGEVQARPGTGTPQINKLTITIHEQYANPRATQTMLDDAGFDIENWLAGKVTRKMSRVENTSFVLGDGSQKPRGFLTYNNWTAPGVYTRDAIEQINSGTSGSFTADGLKLAQNSLLEEYQGSAVWGMKRASFGGIITLKDGNGAYLLDPRSMKIGDDLTLLGKRVVFMNDMPDVAADALSAVYGDFSVGYTIIDRVGFRVIRDQYTQKPYILFYTTKRTGAAVTNYEALKIIKLAA